MNNKGKDSDRTKATQAMPKDGHRGEADGVNSQAERSATGGSDSGAPYPNPHTGKSVEEGENFGGGFTEHGGQSDMSYHGTGQLGEKKVRPGGNPNAGAKDD